MSELPRGSLKELPEKPLRLKNITITFIYNGTARLKPEQIGRFLDALGKGSLNYLLELATKFRELMLKKELEINAIGFPAVKNHVTEEALRRAKKNLSRQAREQVGNLVDVLLKIGDNEPLIIAREGAESILQVIHGTERKALSIDYLDSFPYLRVERAPVPVPFGFILETGRRAGYLDDEDVDEMGKWVNPNTELLIQPMLRFHGGYPAFTLVVAVTFPPKPELELGVYEVNKLIDDLGSLIDDIALALFGKGFLGKLIEVFESVLGFKPEFIYTVFTSVVFASLDFDKSFEELVKTYPLQIAALATGRVGWSSYTRLDAVKDIKEHLVELLTDKMILTGYRGVILTKPQEPLAGFLNPFSIAAILAQDFALTAGEIIDELSNSLRGEEPKPSVLVGLRECVTRLLGELGGYYRLAKNDPFRSIWRTTYRVQELHRAESELKELLSAIDRRLKSVDERRFSVMNILLGTLGVFGALDFILSIFSLWGINTYTIIASGAVALAITALLSMIIRYMRK
jgi:hypothetical protein